MSSPRESLAARQGGRPLPSCPPALPPPLLPLQVRLLYAEVPEPYLEPVSRGPVKDRTGVHPPLGRFGVVEENLPVHGGKQRVRMGRLIKGGSRGGTPL